MRMSPEERDYYEEEMQHPVIHLLENGGKGIGHIVGGALVGGVGVGGLYEYAQPHTPVIQDPFFLLLTGTAALAGAGWLIEGIVRGIGTVPELISDVNYNRRLRRSIREDRKRQAK